MNVAEWILVAFLSVALLVFLILAIILTVKLIKLSNEAREVIEKGQTIADKTGDIVDNVKSYTTARGIAKAVNSMYNTAKDIKKSRKGK